MEELTLEQKVDYIYQTVKAQKRRETHARIVRRIFRLAIIAYFAYFYFFGWKILLNMVTNMSNSMLGPDITNMMQAKFVDGFKAGINWATGNWTGSQNSWAIQSGTTSKVDVNSLMHDPALIEMAKKYAEQKAAQNTKY